MSEKQICCCGASGWTRVIGWLEVVLSVLAMLAAGNTLADLIRALANIDHLRNDYDNRLLTEEEREITKFHLILMTTFVSLLLFIVTCALIMAIVLLRGSYNKNARHLQIWIIYTVICSIFWAILTIAETFVTFDDKNGSTLLSLVIGLSIQGFCVWVVNAHRKDIEGTAILAVPRKV